MLTIGVDPDTHHTAVALLENNRPREIVMLKAHHALRGSAAVRATVRAAVDNEVLFSWRSLPVEKIVVEGQKIYPGSKENPEDLLLLANISGALVVVLDALFRGAEIGVPTPSAWKGSVPKAIHQKRILAEIGVTQSQLAIRWPCPTHGLSPATNTHAIDAVGMALWANTIPARRWLDAPTGT